MKLWGRGTILIVCTLLLALAGCATPRSARVPMEPGAWASLPPEDRQKIEAGEVGVGFTEEMVLAALGRPSRKLRQVTAEGESMIWIYEERERRARFSFGVGAGTSRSGGAYGGGVSVSPGSRPPVEIMRLTLAGGRVVGLSETGLLPPGTPRR